MSWSVLIATLGLTWRAARSQMLAAVGLAIIAALSPVGVLLVTRSLIDHASSHDGSVPVLPAVALGLLIAAYFTADALNQYQGDRLQRRVQLTASGQFVAAVADAPIAYFDDPAWYDAMTRAAADVAWRPLQVMYLLIRLITSVVTAVGTTILVAAIEPALVALVLAAVVPLAVVRRGVTQSLYDNWTATTEVMRRQDYLRDLVIDPRAAQEIKAYELGPAFVAEHARLTAELDRPLSRLIRNASLRVTLTGLGAAVLLALGVAVTVRHGVDGRLSPGDLAVVFAAFVPLVTSVAGILESVLEAGEHSAFLADFFKLTQGRHRSSTETAPEGSARGIASPTAMRVEVCDVSFTYPGARRPALRNVSLAIRPGEVVALVGANGAGKTTLVKLLLGLYSPTGGRIEVDGEDLSEIDAVSYRRRVGAVLQDFARYSATVRDNVGYGRVWEAGTDEELWSALRAADADGLVSQLPQGLDANLTRRFGDGQELSGGQWQRIALARLLHRQPDLWILDEPTAALDAIAEAKIFEAWRDSLSGRSGLLLSHRFSTVRTADRIAVLDDGVIVEIGSHDELVDHGGRYAEMFEKQAAGYL